jgi:phosphoglycolate phosphatase-like HAD superfamily hydrolase
MAHVVWDWNGTLLADMDATVDSVNVVMTEFGAPQITAADYALHYRRPVRDFYEHLLGRQLDQPTWARIDEVWHDHYHAQLDTIPLADQAIDVLDALAAAGHSQSLLSMWWHDLLLSECHKRDIAHWFARIDGNVSGVGDRKSTSLTGHLEALGLDARSPDRDVVVIGDTLDDAEAAHNSGARAILVTFTTHPDRLSRAGVPMIDSLLDLLSHVSKT